MIALKNEKITNAKITTPTISMPRFLFNKIVETPQKVSLCSTRAKAFN
jgi:hypothetical protein